MKLLSLLVALSLFSVNAVAAEKTVEEKTVKTVKKHKKSRSKKVKKTQEVKEVKTIEAKETRQDIKPEKIRIVTETEVVTKIKPTPENQEGFFLNPFLSLEYSAPNITGGGSNSDNFKTDSFENQLKDFQNIAIGLNFRVHKLLGFNFNWAQSDLDSGALNGVNLSQKASYKVKHFNFSALIYAPKIDLVEFFGEAGISDMQGKLTYTDAAGTMVDTQNHKNLGFIGGGFQITPFTNSTDAIRFSAQKYLGKLPSLNDSSFVTVRVGYLMSF